MHRLSLSTLPPQNRTARTTGQLLSPALAFLILLSIFVLADPGAAQASSTSRARRAPWSTAVSAAAAHKPRASTTGVPSGTRLKVHNGNIVVTKAKTVLDRLDVRGTIVIKAPNVRITRSIVRGTSHPATGSALITNYGYKGLVVKDVDLRSTKESVFVDGIKGWNFTALRVHIVGNVDSIKVHGNNVSIRNSLLENTVYYAHDRYQGGGPTHNDNIQVMKGKNISITGNTIRGATNFAILGSANIGNTPNLVIKGNWVDGGHCTVKLQSLKTLQAQGDGDREQVRPASRGLVLSHAGRTAGQVHLEAQRVRIDRQGHQGLPRAVSPHPRSAGHPVDARRSRLRCVGRRSRRTAAARWSWWRSLTHR